MSYARLKRETQERDTSSVQVTTTHQERETRERHKREHKIERGHVTCARERHERDTRRWPDKIERGHMTCARVRHERETQERDLDNVGGSTTRRISREGD